MAASYVLVTATAVLLVEAVLVAVVLVPPADSSDLASRIARTWRPARHRLADADLSEQQWRDGRLRQAISDLIDLANQHGCVGIANGCGGWRRGELPARPHPARRRTGGEPAQDRRHAPARGKTRRSPGDRLTLFPHPTPFGVHPDPPRARLMAIR
ncbi:hypothetical protein [Nonomuraea turcica]|uniref:hypothetical protein n=1 Tax=Nonomuraea sp. G32 TaxID=3067274 RepID=UPI00273C86BA|nr:hypothetical protein [Nonomuraea sp. G32]MDP4509013.1 hypothetical protein [Nonomuraea sp. G32]